MRRGAVGVLGSAGRFGQLPLPIVSMISALLKVPHALALAHLTTRREAPFCRASCVRSSRSIRALPHSAPAPPCAGLTAFARAKKKVQLALQVLYTGSELVELYHLDATMASKTFQLATTIGVALITPVFYQVG